MAATYRVLGQVALDAATLSPVYVCSSNAGAAVSSIVVCNRGVEDTTFRISIALADAADSNGQYLYYDMPICGKDTFVATIGVSLEEGDVIRAYAPSGNISVSIFGVEFST